jgi:hypothetical protein
MVDEGSGLDHLGSPATRGFLQLCPPAEVHGKDHQLASHPLDLQPGFQQQQQL